MTDSSRNPPTETTGGQDMSAHLLNFVLHEVQAGLQALLTDAELLMQEVSKQEESSQRLKAISTELPAKVETLLLITNNLRGGASPVPLQMIDVAEITREVMLVLSERAHQRGLSVRFISDPNVDPTLVASPHVVRQVVFNLLDNAIKYSHFAAGEQRYVAVRLSKSASALRLSFENLGYVVTGNEIEEIFKPYRRGHEAASSSPVGAGLGLYVSQVMLAQHGGRIEFSSRSVAEKQAITRVSAYFPHNDAEASSE